VPATDAISVMVGAAASTVQAQDVPSGACMVAFGCNVDFYVSFGSTNANVPSTSSTAGTTTNRSIFNPTARNFGSTLSCTGLSVAFVSSGVLTMEWFGR
jgi:hypothetical protein